MLNRKMYWFEQILIDADGKIVGTRKSMTHSKKEYKEWQNTKERVIVVKQ